MINMHFYFEKEGKKICMNPKNKQNKQISAKACVCVMVPQ